MKAVFIERFGGPEVLQYGDLPDAVWFLRPLAITAAFDLAIPLRASNKSVSS